MCVKLLPRDLNPGPFPPHLTSTYTYGIIIVPKVCSGESSEILPLEALI